MNFFSLNIVLVGYVRIDCFLENTKADPGICERGTVLPFFPLPFLSRLPSLPSPLEVGPLNQLEGLGERCKLPQRVRGGAPADKEFGMFSLKLSESHWWQSFWIFWVPCFTVERSQFCISWHDDGVTIVQYVITYQMYRENTFSFAYRLPRRLVTVWSSCCWVSSAVCIRCVMLFIFSSTVTRDCSMPLQ